MVRDLVSKGKPERDVPHKLSDNEGCAYEGAIVLGMGFTLTPDERDYWVGKDAHNAEVIFPYLGGHEVNTSPTQDYRRYVINFGERTLEEVSDRWPELLDIVREKVKPERDKKDGKKYPRIVFEWWKYCNPCKSLYAALQPLRRCLVTAQVSKHLCFSFQPTGRIFSMQLYVFPLEHHAAFAVLQSRIHEPWVRLLSSSLEDRLRYAASDCFDTFPFPTRSPRDRHPTLEHIGELYYNRRAQHLIDHNIGLTTFYNDPPRWHRDLKYELDTAVLDAYGLPHNASDLTIVDHLYDLNRQRAIKPYA